MTAATTLVACAIATGPCAFVMKRRETLSLARDNACLLLRTGNGAVPPFREIVGLRRAASDLDWRRNYFTKRAAPTSVLPRGASHELEPHSRVW